MVKQIEAGKLDTPETEEILRKALEPMIAEGIDTVVLGCTHYPFVIPLIRKIVGDRVRVIDPAPAIARQVQRLIEANQIEMQPAEPPVLKFYTTGNIVELDGFLHTTLGIRVKSQPLNWTLDNRLIR